MQAGNPLPISRYDDLLYDVTLQETNPVTGATMPLTSGTVTAHLSLWPPSITPLGQTQRQLLHTSGGRWVEGVDADAMNTTFQSLATGTRLAVVYMIQSTMVRYREAVLVDILRTEDTGP